MGCAFAQSARLGTLRDLVDRTDRGAFLPSRRPIAGRDTSRTGGEIAARGWKALIRADSAERADAIDTLLWTYDDQSFLAHAQAGDGETARQPVLITVEEGNPEWRSDLFLCRRCDAGGLAKPK